MVRGGRRLRTGSGGAQVAAEAMTYDRARRTDCNTPVGATRDGSVERPSLASRAVRGTGATPVGPDRGGRTVTPPDRGDQRRRGIHGPSGPDHGHRPVRRAQRRADRCPWLRNGARRRGPAPPAGLPPARERPRRRAAAGRSSAARSSRSARRFGPAATSARSISSSSNRRVDADDVTESLLEEALRSAANKGCASVEAPRPDDPAERARWERQGFDRAGPLMGRVRRAGRSRRTRSVDRGARTGARPAAPSGHRRPSGQERRRLRGRGEHLLRGQGGRRGHRLRHAAEGGHRRA